MAGDWIKIREDLHEDAAVIQIATRMKVRPEVVVGYLVRFWSWVSRNTADGSITGVTLDAVENALHMPHFLGFMRDVGWLDYIESTNGVVIHIPNFERHLSESAKKRAHDQQRKRAARSCPTSVPKKTDNLRTERGPEERRVREDKKLKESKPKKSGGKPPAFAPPSAKEVQEYATEKGYSCDPEAFVDYYGSQGWKKANGRPVVDWKGCLRTWIKNQARFGPVPGSEEAEVSNRVLRHREITAQRRAARNAAKTANGEVR